MKKVLLIGEPLIRIMPTNYQEIADGVESRMFFGGSEMNIACNLQGFGYPTKVLTALPEGPLGDRFMAFLVRHGIDVSAIQRVGERIGLYYMESGFGCRPSQVYYDRSHSSLAAMRIEQLDMEQLFEDVALIHFSGITLAIDPTVTLWMKTILEEAKKRNLPISIDLNWRSKMIGKREAKKLFSEFAVYADYCFGIEPIMKDAGDWDLFDRDEAGLYDIEERMLALKETYDFQTIFHTVRQMDDMGRNHYRAYGLAEEFICSVELKTQVLQRVGSGDAFVAGAIYQLLKKASLEETVNFAVASGTYKCSLEGDQMVQSVDRIKSLLDGKNEIIR
ncbi:sugar kinase [Streptococcus ruminantium]|uniref:sugar kinase n=1 Tax=Streptococcus ruminantium TaxID=1917441 RepID=UPI0012DF6592|nr:sugar kinase [Streptococcus ruminantium]